MPRPTTDQLAALRAECVDDPAGLGLRAHLPPDAAAHGTPAAGDGDFVAMAAALAAPDPSGAVLPVGEVAADRARRCLTRDEYTALDSARRDFLAFALGGLTLSWEEPAGRAEWEALFPATTPLGQRLAALLLRPMTRAEALFGPGVILTHEDVGAAFAVLRVQDDPPSASATSTAPAGGS